MGRGKKKGAGKRDVSRILFPPSPKRRQTRPCVWVGPLPADSSGQPGARAVRAAPSPPIWPCSRWGLPCPPCRHEGGALLPHRFTLACGPLVASPSAVYFLWHFPWAFARWALPTTVPCGVRTFLPPRRIGTGGRIARSPDSASIIPRKPVRGKGRVAIVSLVVWSWLACLPELQRRRGGFRSRPGC